MSGSCGERLAAPPEARASGGRGGGRVDANGVNAEKREEAAARELVHGVDVLNEPRELRRCRPGGEDLRCVNDGRDAEEEAQA